MGANESVSYREVLVAISSKRINRSRFLNRSLAIEALNSGFALLQSSEKRYSNVSLCNRNTPTSNNNPKKAYNSIKVTC